MKKEMKFFLKCVFLQTLILFASCNNQDVAQYNVDGLERTSFISLKTWNILGPVSNPNPNVSSDFLTQDHLKQIGIPESLFVKNPFEYKLKDLPLHGETYSSEEPIIDLKNTKKINTDDSDYYGSAVYYYCNLHSSNQDKIYLLTRSSAGIKVWLNAEMIYESFEEKEFELTFSEFIPLNLKAGDNCLVIKRINLREDMLFESILCKKDLMIEGYQKSIAGKLFYPPLIGDTLHFKENHQEILDSSFNLNIYNTKGDSLLTFFVKDGLVDFPVPELADNNAYMAKFKIDGYEFVQPFYKGNPDEAYDYYCKERTKYSDNDTLCIQIDAYLYRLHTLLNHSSRADDWWWPLKVSSLIYELDNLITNFSDKEFFLQNTSGIQYRAYFSELDDTPQHYLLITPDNIPHAEKIPLVVMIRPAIENHHHFLTSPQVARYWSLAFAKYLANKYQYIIMMSAGRMYADEELTPMAEAETLLAMEDVRHHYNIDENRIYLHGNCLGASRCISMACKHPDKFAALGLYAPVYYPIPKNQLANLKGMPAMIHYDPLDEHTPYSMIKKVIADTENDLDLSLSFRKYSGMHYNVLLVGEEAFSYFQDHSKSGYLNDTTPTVVVENERKIPDLFSQPFVFVYDSSNKSNYYENVVHDIQNEYEEYLFSKCPLVSSDNIKAEDILTKNLFLIGEDFDNAKINKIIAALPMTEMKKEHIEQAIKGDYIFQAIFENPQNSEKSIVVYSTSNPKLFSHKIKYPWKNSSGKYKFVEVSNSRKSLD